MSDIRDGMAADPNYEPLSDPGSMLWPETPPGSSVVINDDGTATFDVGEEEIDKDSTNHFANLAETIDSQRLNTIAQELLDQIEIDKEARKERDTKYEDGLRRTGLGDDAPGGAPFNGASRAIHPMMTEAIIDYAARVCSEMLPPEGPAKSAVIGIPTNDKTSRGERVARYTNWQLTEQMPSFYSEVEMGFSQEGLAGAFYLKLCVKDNQPDVEVVYVDHVHRSWSEGDFYNQPRITHEMATDRWTFESNVKGGLWVDVVETRTSSDNIEETASTQANDRIIGRQQPTENIDEVRTVYEVSTKLALEGPDDDVLPYLITIDEQTRRVLSVYRNWKEEDANQFRLDFLIEFPFLPWRGGSPIGLAHMIGSLSGAATGALRALMDSALLATMATGVKLKGGTTAGGQNIRPQPGSTVEIAGSLATDPDIRKTYSQLEFPPPSPVLFQLLGFLVDAGRGVVRTTFDEFSKMTNEMPVGTANLMVEQGLKTFGSVFGRQHRAMKRFLRMLWYVNQKTVQNEQVVDEFGELIVTKEDFEGPVQIIPVSDPRIFTDTQRMAGAQMVASRNDTYAQKGLPNPYKTREVELNLMRQAKVAQPEQFLVAAPEPAQINAAAENVAASQGLPVKAYPGQDHEAHIAQHAAYMNSPLFGANPTIALKFLPIMLNHFSEHLALWYADAMLVLTNTVLQETFHDPRITLEALQTVKGLEVQLDRLMAEMTPHVMQHAQQILADVMPVIQQAQDTIKKLQPPVPMDPSVVAQQDVQRQAEADKAKAQLDQAEQARKTNETQARLGLEHKKVDGEQQLSQAELQQKADQAEKDRAAAAEQALRKDTIAAAGVDVNRDRNDVTRETAAGAQATQRENAETQAQTQLTVTDADNETALEIVDKEIKAGKHKPAIKNGKGLNK